MNLEKTMDGDVLVMALSGEFDTMHVDRFAAEIQEAIDGGTTRVLVGMQALTFINSTALGSLLREQKRLHQAGGELACAELSSFAAKTFKVLGLDRRIRCFDAVAEGVAWLAEVDPLLAGSAMPEDGTGEGDRAGEGTTRVAFSFPDSDESRTWIGDLRDLGEQGMLVAFENLDETDIDALFRTGRAVEVAFRLPLYHPSHEFRPVARVGTHDELPGRKVQVRFEFDSISEIEETAIRKYVQDLEYIRDEVAEEGSGDDEA